MSKEEVRRLGVKLEDSGISEIWGQRYRATGLPKQFGDERWVWLYFGNYNRLFRILAELADRGMAYTSKDAIQRYHQIKANLSSGYVLVSKREAKLPKGEPCLSQAKTAPDGNSSKNSSVKNLYINAIKTGGHHKFVSMMHFCAIQHWSSSFRKDDTYIIVTIRPKDVHKMTSYAFVHLEIGSKSLIEKFRREKSPL